MIWGYLLIKKMIPTGAIMRISAVIRGLTIGRRRWGTVEWRIRGDDSGGDTRKQCWYEEKVLVRGNEYRFC
jgi:hypothetical protein